MKDNILSILNDKRLKVTRDSWSFLNFEIEDVNKNEIIEVFERVKSVDIWDAGLRIDGVVHKNMEPLLLLMDQDTSNQIKYDILVKAEKKKLVNKVFTSTKDLILFSNFDNFLKEFVKYANEFSFQQKIKVLIFDDQNKKIENSFVEIYLNKELKIDINYKKVNVESKKNIEQFIDLVKNYLLIDVNSIADVPLFWKGFDDNHRVENLLLKQFIELTANSVKEDSYVYSGRKNVIIDYSDKNIEVKVNIVNLIKIIDFLNSENNFLDRILILRNSLTRQLNSKNNINDFVEVVNNIYIYLTNEYQLFINQEVEIFLDQKDKLYIEAMNVSNYINNLTNEISSYFRNIIAGLLGTVFITMLQNILSNYSRPMITLTLLSYTVYLLFMISILHSLNDQKNIGVNNFRNYLNNYPYKFDGADFETIKEELLEETLKTFNTAYNKSKKLIIILIVLFISMFIVFRFQVDFLCLKTISKFILGM